MKKAILLSSIFWGLCIGDYHLFAGPVVELIAHQTALAPTESNIKKLAQDFAKKFPDPFSLDTSHVEKIGKMNIPLLQNGNMVLNNNQIVYSFVAKNNAVASIFVKFGNDFVRIASSLRKEDDSSARGVILDRSSIAYKEIKNGSSYVGKVVLFGKEYMAEYDPIRDENQNVIGILFVGIPTSK